MRPIRLIAASAAILCFTGCALPFGILTPQQAPAASTSVSVDDEDAIQPDDDASSASSTAGGESSASSTAGGADVSSIAARGGTSKECTAVSAVLMSGAQLPLAAASGEVTQEMVDKAFAASSVKDIPADAKAAFDKLKSAGQALVGIDYVTGTDQLNAFEDAYSFWVDVTTKVCS